MEFKQSWKFAISLSIISATMLLSCTPKMKPSNQAQTLCPLAPTGTIDTPSFASEPKKRVFILIDKSASFKNYTSQSLDLIQGILPSALSAGDDLTISWIGTDTASSKLFADTVPEVAIPNITPLPTPALTPTILPTPNGPDSVRQQQEATATAIARYNAQAMNEYGCDYARWVKASENILTVWQSRKNEIAKQFSEKALETIRPLIPQNDNDFAKGTYIYEGIYSASKSFQTNARSFPKNKLLILSDMLDEPTMEDNPERAQTFINLSNVDVIVAMVPCDIASQCYEIEKKWSTHFTQYQAKSINFLLIPNTSVNDLAALMER